ncbi:hypothetical protein LJC59_00255 [Desulfovibrio sp. OttesenSCG-928-A18]|nr:hypothetical protein [Desulfovibrio sp. OttesenSCG-928-A18]
MNAELLREISQVYSEREEEFLPREMAADRSASSEMERVLSSFFSRWQKRFDRMARRYADWFAEQTEKVASRQIRGMLKEIGFTVEFKHSHYVNNILQAAIHENVGLIRSIPEQMHDKVRGIVMRGVQAGNDQHYIATELRKQFGITERRARFIARDQTQKANNAVSLARSAEAGIEYGFWMHRSGSKKPRTTHLGTQMNGVRFKLSDGLYDPDPRVRRKVKPGELPGCLCGYKPDLSSFKPQTAADSAMIRPLKVKYEQILERITCDRRRAV